MKKTIIVIVTLFTFSYSSSISGGGIAYSRGTDKSKNITTFLDYNVIAGFDLRFEYNRNISDYKDYFKSNINRYALFATYTQSLGYSFSLTPKIGIVKTDGKFETLDTLQKVTDSSTSFTYGIELNYDLSDNAAAFVGYTDYGHKFETIKDIKSSDINSKNITIGLKLHL